MSRTFPLKSIRGRLVLLLLIVLIPVVLIEVFLYYRRFETRKAEELQANLEMARAIAKSFETFVQDLVRSELVAGLALTGSQPITDRDRNHILDTFQSDNPAVRSVFWVNPAGSIVASSLRTYIHFDVSDRSFVQEIIAGRNWAVSELILGKATGKPAFTVSRGIRSEQGKLLGIVAASIEPDRLDSVFGIGRSKEAGVSLIDRKGMLVYRYPTTTKHSWEQRNWLKFYPTMDESLKGKEILTSIISELTGKKRLVAFTPVSSIGWVAAASRGEDEVMRATTSTLLFQAGLVLLVTLTGFGAAVVLARPLSNSIIRLRDHALALGRGEGETFEMTSGPEELKDLAVAFNQMAGEVRLREGALRESEEKYRNLVKYAPAAIYEVDLQGTKFLSVNEVMCGILGYSREELLSARPTDFLDQESRPLFKERIQKKLAGQRIDETMEYRIRRKDGKWIDAALNVGAITYEDEKPTRVVVIGHDITERKRIEQALRRSEERYRLLAETMLQGVVHQDADGNIIAMNPAAELILGRSRADFPGSPLVNEERPALRENGEPFPDMEHPARVALRTCRQVRDVIMGVFNPKAGDYRWITVDAVPVCRPGETRPSEVYTVFEDITERKRSEEALQQRTFELQELTETLEQRVGERTAELANLSSQLVSAQEDERRRVSYDLHDNAWQTLEIIKSQLEHLFSRQAQPDWTALHQKSGQLIPLIRNTVARIRSMQGDLWPYVLDDIGILGTLEWYCREFRTNHPALGIEMHVDLAEDEIPSSAKIVIYRILQETLSNVAKHSLASHATLRLIKKENRMEFAIGDNGIGFDPEETIFKRFPWGRLGLMSIKARTELSGGIFGVESAPEKGTTVRASWPL
jgi:PAS domain S-box-containing protein